MPSPGFRTPNDAESAFYQAFQRTDLGMMGNVWLQGAQARCVHPGGELLRGYGPVLESWRSIFAGASSPTVRFQVIDRIDHDSLSVHLVEERIGRTAAKGELARVLATNTYLLTAQGWHMILHHATLPLTEADEALRPATSGQRLH